MSQFYVKGSSAIPPGTFVETLTGNTGGAVSPDVSSNISLLGSGDITVTGTPGSHTLTISNNSLSGSGTTTGISSADLITFPLGAVAGTYFFTFNVAEFEASTPAGAGFNIFVPARTTGAAATVIGSQNTTEIFDVFLASNSVNVVASGNNIILRATSGVAVVTVNWTATGNYEFAHA